MVIRSLNLTAQKSLFESIRNASIKVINDLWQIISLISLFSGSGAFFLMQLFVIIPMTRGETINARFES